MRARQWPAEVRPPYAFCADQTALSCCAPDRRCAMRGRYGQSYLCITMDGDMLEKVADALVIAHMVISDSDTDSAKNSYPKLDLLATTKFPCTPHMPPFHVMLVHESR